MFTKRKGIVIGETYLFDVLNETNMASAVSLVTVVKKTGFRKYTVISVNNGYVFETKAKYLTPYTDPEKATVIRCQYGTTEFNNEDIIGLALIRNVLEICSKCFGNDSKDDLVDTIYYAKGIVEYLEAKIQPYVNISNYKDTMKVISKFNNNTYDKESDLDNSYEDHIFEQSNFKEYFNDLVNEYIDGNLDLDDFISEAKDLIRNEYPIELLRNYDKNQFFNTKIDSVLADIVGQSYKNNSVAFIIAVDEDNKLCVKEFYHKEDDDSMVIFNKLKDFIHNIYPKLDTDESFVPEYRFNVISVKMMEENEDE